MSPNFCCDTQSIESEFAVKNTKDPSCFVSVVQTDGGCVRIVGYFSLHTLHPSWEIMSTVSIPLWPPQQSTFGIWWNGRYWLHIDYHVNMHQNVSITLLNPCRNKAVLKARGTPAQHKQLETLKNGQRVHRWKNLNERFTQLEFVYSFAFWPRTGSCRPWSRTEVRLETLLS